MLIIVYYIYIYIYILTLFILKLTFLYFESILHKQLIKFYTKNYYLKNLFLKLSLHFLIGIHQAILFIILLYLLFNVIPRSNKS